MSAPLTLESSVAHQLVLIGIGLFIVIFFLLYLLHRERGRPRNLQPQRNITINNYAPTVHQQIVRQSSDKLAEENNASATNDEKQETPVKTVERGTPNNGDAGGVRHRNVCRNLATDACSVGTEARNAPGLGNEEIADRVFSEPQLMAQNRTEVPSNEGKAFLDTGTFNQHQDGETSPKQLDDLGTAIKGRKSMKEEKSRKWVCQVRTFKSASSTESFQFEVDGRGCEVVARYCKVYIPPDCIEEPETIIMTPNYMMQSQSPHEVIITPYVTFKTQSGREPKFTKDVTLSLYSGYSAADGKKNLPVQVLWRKDESFPLKRIAVASVGHERFISFVCRHFCGFCIAAEQANFHCMRRHYYYAGYVRKSTAQTRIFHWMIFEDCPALFDQMVSYMKDDDKEVAMDPESFHVDYDYTLQIIINKHHIGPVDGDREDVRLNDSWGSRVNLTHQFEMEKFSGQPNANLKGKYQMFAIHNRDSFSRNIRDKHFYYEWKEPEPPMPSVPSTINVYDNATGYQINMPTTGQRVRHQESVESNTSGQSSGYGSPVGVNRTFSLSEGNETTALQATHQSFGFNDQEEASSTTPKQLRELGHGHMKRHSTPKRPPVVPENNMQMECAAEDCDVAGSLGEDNSEMEPILPPAIRFPCLQGMTDDTSIAEIPSDRDSGLDTFHVAPLENDSLPVFSVSGDSGLDDSHLSPQQQAAFENSTSSACGADGGSRGRSSVDDVWVFDRSPTSDSPNGSLVIAAADATAAEENAGTAKPE